MASVSSDSSDDDELLYQTSARRKLLVADIKAGRHHGVAPKQLWLSRPEYQSDTLQLFRSRYYSIRKTFEDKLERKQRDEQAFDDDKKLDGGIGTTNWPYPKFKGSEAEQLLKYDLDEGLHETMLPRELHKLHAEYAAWPLEVFRNHIHQELKDRKQRPYWLAERKEKEEKKIEKAKAKAKAKAKKQK
jgi:hypothetical protein